MPKNKSENTHQNQISCNTDPRPNMRSYPFSPCQLLSDILTNRMDFYYLVAVVCLFARRNSWHTSPLTETNTRNKVWVAFKSAKTMVPKKWIQGQSVCCDLILGGHEIDRAN